MDENLHDIDHLFQEGIEGRTEAPPAKIWDSLSAQLDADGQVKIRRKYRSLKRVSLLLLLLLCGSVGYIVVDGVRGEKAKVEVEERKIKSGTERKEAEEGEVEERKVEDEVKVKEGVVGVREEKVEGGKVEAEVEAEVKVKVKVKVKVEDESEVMRKRKNLLNKVHNAEFLAASDQERQDFTTDWAGLQALAGSVSLQVADRSAPGSALRSSGLPFLNSPGLPLKKAAVRKPAMPGNFSIQPFVSLGSFNHERLQSDRNRYREDDRGAIKEKEEPGFVLNAGILAEYRLGKHLGIHSGLVYMRQSLLIQPKKLYARRGNNGDVGYRFNCSSGYAYFNTKSGSMPMPGDSANAFRAENLQHYLSLPLGLSYSAGKGKFSFRATAGLSANFLLRASLATTVDDGLNKAQVQTTTVEGVTPLYFNAYFGLGTEYAINPRLRLTLQPQYSIAFSSKTRDAPVKTYPNSMGLGLGLRVGL